MRRQRLAGRLFAGLQSARADHNSKQQAAMEKIPSHEEERRLPWLTQRKWATETTEVTTS
jgi:hypothetical protein